MRFFSPPLQIMIIICRPSCFHTKSTFPTLYVTCSLQVALVEAKTVACVGFPNKTSPHDRSISKRISPPPPQKRMPKSRVAEDNTTRHTTKRERKQPTNPLPNLPHTIILPLSSFCHQHGITLLPHCHMLFTTCQHDTYDWAKAKRALAPLYPNQQQQPDRAPNLPLFCSTGESGKRNISNKAS